MSGVQIRRMDEIENWRRKAYALSRSDPLGNLVMKSLVIAQTVQREGTTAEDLPWQVKSLGRNRNQIMNEDSLRNDPVRSLMYGMSASIESMIESIIDGSVDQNRQADEDPHDNSGVEQDMDVFNEYQADPAEPLDLLEDSDMHLSFGMNRTIKRERQLDMYAASEMESPTTENVHPGSIRQHLGSTRADNHRRNVNASDTAKGFPCSNCGKRFDTERAMKIHAFMHKKQQQSTTPAAAKSAKKNKDSRKKCKQCGMAFRSPAHEEEHMRKHTGEKPFSCTLCPMAFAGNSYLTRHRREAYGEKPYECSPCGENFARRAELFQHNTTDAHKSKLDSP